MLPPNPQRVPFTDPRTGFITLPWLRFLEQFQAGTAPASDVAALQAAISALQASVAGLTATLAVLGGGDDEQAPTEQAFAIADRLTDELRQVPPNVPAPKCCEDQGPPALPAPIGDESPDALDQFLLARLTQLEADIATLKDAPA